MANTLLISVQYIKDITQLHGNVDEGLVFPEIQTAQDMFLEPLLGTALFLRLLKGVEESNLTSDENFLIDNYVAKCLAYYTLSELPEGLWLQFYNSGMVRLKSDDSEGPALDDLLIIAKRYKTRAEFYAERLVNFLKENASQSKYSEYLNPGSGSAVRRPDEDGYTSSFFLD